MSNPLKDLELSSEELKEIAALLAKKRNIRGYKSMSEDRLLSALKESLKESEKNFDDRKLKTNFSKARIEKIRKEFKESRHKFSKSKINETRRNLTELEENLYKTKKYYDYDDIEYKGIRNIKDLFDLSIDEDYRKPIITKGAFNGNFIQYESKGDKGKDLSIKKYLNMIKP